MGGRRMAVLSADSHPPNSSHPPHSDICSNAIYLKRLTWALPSKNAARAYSPSCPSLAINIFYFLHSIDHHLNMIYLCLLYHLTPLKRKFHHSRVFFHCFVLVSLQHLEQCLTYMRNSINICRMAKWMNSSWCIPSSCFNLFLSECMWKNMLNGTLTSRSESQTDSKKGKGRQICQLLSKGNGIFWNLEAASLKFILCYVK